MMTLRAVLLGMPLPVTIFLVYGWLRLQSIQPPTESGMSEVMTTGFFFCAAGITYFTAVLLGAGRDMKPYRVYLVLAWLFALMGIDETFMLHEQAGAVLGSELPVFILYAVIILACVFFLRKATVAFYLGIGLFGGFGGIAVASDHVYMEGVYYFMGREIDYEQMFKAVGALFAAVAFGTRAGQSLKELYFNRFREEGETELKAKTTGQSATPATPSAPEKPAKRKASRRALQPAKT